MLSEYRDFLVNVRNNLIQSGVEYPIRPMDTYEELFYEAVNLQQVLWYFSVMAIGDDSQELGMPGYFIDLSGYYRDKMRKRFYEEFRASIDDYKVLSKTAIKLRDLAPESPKGTEEPVYKVIHGIFVEDLPSIKKEKKRVIEEPMEAEFSPSPVPINDMVGGMNFFRNISVPKPILEIIHGVFVEDIGVNKEEVSSDSREVHGTYIEDIGIITRISESGGNYVADSSEIHGTFIEDLKFYGETPCINTGSVVNYNKDSDSTVVRGTFIEDIVIGSSKVTVEKVVENRSVKEPVRKPVERVKTNGDLSDVLQDITNDLLTRGKRVLVEEQRKLMKG